MPTPEKCDVDPVFLKRSGWCTRRWFTVQQDPTRFSLAYSEYAQSNLCVKIAWVHWRREIAWCRI